MSPLDIANTVVLIRGAGDLATGVGHRLFLTGFRVIMTEIPEPVCVRRAVSFGEAVFEKTVQVEGVEARVAQLEELARWPFKEAIPVIVDEHGRSIEGLKPLVLIDARMFKQNFDTRIDQAPIVGTLGPGFRAGQDCHFVVETNRGHQLGRVIYQGSAEPNTGQPAPVKGETIRRTLYAPRNGLFQALVEIGETVKEGATVGQIEGTPLVCEIPGTVRGILRSGLHVRKGTKITDIDPRGQASFCHTISDKSHAVAGGVLEGILTLARIMPRFSS